MGLVQIITLSVSNSNSDATLTIQMKSLLKGQKVTSTLKKTEHGRYTNNDEHFRYWILCSACTWRIASSQIPWGVLYIFRGWESLHLCRVALLGEINSVAQKAVSSTYQPVTKMKPPPATKINPYVPPQMTVINKSATWREAASQKMHRKQEKNQMYNSWRFLSD